MRSIPVCAALAASALLACFPAASDPLAAGSEWQRNGTLSRHVWTPGFASGDVAGLRVSAGLAIGLRGAVRSNLDRRVAPSLSFDLNRQSRLSLLPAGSRGAMLVLQTRN